MLHLRFDDTAVFILFDAEIDGCVGRHVGLAVHIGDGLADARCIDLVDARCIDLVDGRVNRHRPDFVGGTSVNRSCADASSRFATGGRHRAAFDGN